MAKSSPKKPADDQPISPEERDRLFESLASRPLALCVSGGPDSMALMHLVAEWAVAAPNELVWKRTAFSTENSRASLVRPERLPVPSWLPKFEAPQELKVSPNLPPIVVLTVDHGLRPEAAEEAEFVAQAAKRLGLVHQSLAADEPPPATGVQEWARDLRHRLILELLDAESWWLHDRGIVDHRAIARHVVMAHHLDDQAETVLMRLARGSGLRGLGGMSDQQPLSIGAGRGRSHVIGGLVHRPFLSIPKSRLLATLQAKCAKWVEDPSNNDERFERVRIRKAVELLRGVGVGSAGLALSAARLRAAESSLDCFETIWRRELINEHGGLVAELPSANLHERGEFPFVRLLSHLLASFGGNSRPAELAQVEQLRERLMGWDGPFKGATLGGCRIELEGTYRDGRLLIYREGNGEGLETLLLGPGQAVEWDGGRFRIEADEAALAEVEVRALGASGWAGLKRQIDGLDELKLKAAAMATMPAIWRGGDLISVPLLESLLSKPDTPAKVAKAWANWRKPEAGLYKAKFLPNHDF